jgi:hypothetical protein
MKHLQTFESFINETKINESDVNKNPKPQIFKDSTGKPLEAGQVYSWNGEDVTFTWEDDVLMADNGIQVHSSDYAKLSKTKNELPILGVSKTTNSNEEKYSNVVKFIEQYTKEEIHVMPESSGVCILFGNMNGKKPSINTAKFNEIESDLNKKLGSLFIIKVREPRIWIYGKTYAAANKLNDLLK